MAANRLHLDWSALISRMLHPALVLLISGALLALIFTPDAWTAFGLIFDAAAVALAVRAALERTGRPVAVQIRTAFNEA